MIQIINSLAEWQKFKIKAYYLLSDKHMNKEEEQLIKLLINNPQSAWEIEGIYKRCGIYFGFENAFHECQEVIDFAKMAGIELLESFRLQVEISEEISALSIKRAGI